MTHVFTIPPDVSFVEAMAARLWDEAVGDPLKLANGLILLPTRRACRHLREAFLRAANGEAALLPRMQPLGDVDESELYFTQGALESDIPPAIAPLRRTMLLTRLIVHKDKTLPFDQAAQMAEALAGLLDQVQIEGCDFADLNKLVPPGNLAEHWQQTIKFLEIVTATWPGILADEECIDPADRRNRVMRRQAEAWRAAPPAYPVIAAGSTASVPAVAELMAVIADMPLGRVVLPGLDQDLDEEAWQAIEESHPQYGMKKWLERVGIERTEVNVWEMSKTDTPSPAERVRLLQESMRPADTTNAWRTLSPHVISKDAVRGLTRLELEHQQEEADVIALRLRATLEVEGQTAALVTPDRALAERVAAALARWGIEANDSAGKPLTSLPEGSFLCEAIQAANPDAGAVDYLSLLKHPLAAVGLEPSECRRLTRDIEKAIWRGVRLTSGWQGAVHALRQRQKDGERHALAWLETIAAWFEPLTLTWPMPLPLETRIKQHMELAEKIASTPDQDGSARLWRKEAGEAAASFFDDWLGACAGLPEITGDDYARLLAGLMGGIVVRPAFGQHPRLGILGPLEARLHHADVMILGSMNEGTWPPEQAVDPWMSRPMKRDFGLPLPERRVGLSAHDFVQLASAKEVMITRARRVDGSPTVPSRFLLQVEAVLQALGHHGEGQDALAPEAAWTAWAKALDAPEKMEPCAPPEPCPPVKARPNTLSVTEIGTWLHNPYAIYARRVLRLEPLDDIDADVTAADRGTIVHEALEKFLALHKDTLPPDPLGALLAIGREAFAPYQDRPQVMAFWWPRFERVARKFIADEQQRRLCGVRVLAVEAKGEMALAEGSFTLRGRADRIDKLPDGTAVVIDYKTGAVPPKKAVDLGYEPQLPLLAAMAERGGFKDLGALKVSVVSYWPMKGGRADDKKVDIADDMQGRTRQACDQLEQLIAEFAKPFTPYRAVPRPRLAPKYNDYEHLSRLDEWSKTGGEA